MAVLQPEDHVFAVVRRGQSRIEIGWSGIRVVCGRLYVWLIAIGVEGVFDDVVTSDANGVNEELAGEGGQVEPRPNIGAVEYDGSFWSAAILAPRCEHAPVARKQPAPKTHRFCAVARPVVRGD